MLRKFAVTVGVLVLCAMATSVPAAAAGHHRVVLGAKHLFEPYGKGWGTAHPKTIFNGGDPSGYVFHITWKHWGTERAKGQGLGNQFRPGGGYYGKHVKVQFRAEKLGRCSSGGPRAYTILKARFQNKPGGAYGNWFHWAGLKTICKSNY